MTRPFRSRASAPGAPAGQGCPRGLRSPAVRRVLPPLAWFVLLLVCSTDLASAANTAGLLARVVHAFAPGVPLADIARLNAVLRMVGHMTGYGILALLVRPTAGGSSVLAVLIAVAAAALDETLQLTTRARTGSVADVGLDAAGAVVALAAAALVRRLRESAMIRAVASRMFALLVVFLAAGCAPSLPYRLDLGYQPPAAAPARGQALVVGLAGTRDARGLGDPASIGRRITTEGTVEPMVAAREKAEAIVTDALRARLVALGHPVRAVAAWDLTAETLDPSWGDAVLGAEVLDFWTEAKSEPLKPTTIASRARIRLVLGNPKARRIVWTNTVGSASQQDVVRFSESAAARNANEALVGAIRALVESPDLRDRLAALP